MPTAVVVRGPRLNAVRAQPPPSLWLLTRLHTLRIAKLVCLSKRSIKSLNGLTRLRHLAATVDVRAAWRFPTTLETLELTCGERHSTDRVRLRSARLHVRTFASLTALRRLTIDASLSEHPGRVAASLPSLVELDYAGSLSRSVRHPGLVVESLAQCATLTSVRVTGHLSASDFSVLGMRPHLERASLQCFSVERPAPTNGADRLFAQLRELTFSCQYGSASQMIGAAARMPALEMLRIDDYPYESLRPLCLAGSISALVSLAITDTWHLASLDGIEFFASSPLRALDLSRTGVREMRALANLTGLERLRLDDVSPTSGKHATFPSSPLPSLRHLSIRGCAHWRQTARKTFPNAEITPIESSSLSSSVVL